MKVVVPRRDVVSDVLIEENQPTGSQPLWTR